MREYVTPIKTLNPPAEGKRAYIIRNDTTGKYATIVTRSKLLSNSYTLDYLQSKLIDKKIIWHTLH